MLPRLLGEDIETIFHLGPKLERINADRAQIEQIILNMAVNARDAMPRGGSLIFKTTNVNLRKPQMQMDGAVLPVGTYVGFIVTDTGSGMSPEIQSQIFEPFFTTKEQGKGTGLGLATVYGIVKESSGFITVESAPGKGSTFKMYFPSIEVVHEASPPSALMLPPPAGAETILLVEDEAALREITCEYLQGLGYTILPASSGLRALDICRMHDGPIHILLTDIIMPGIRGPDLVRAAMEIRPELHVIYMSGYSDRDMETGAVPEHMSFLAKPYSLESLAHTIRTVASGSGATVH
jgi:CheY-like chemotaxis protein